MYKKFRTNFQMNYNQAKNQYILRFRVKESGLLLLSGKMFSEKKKQILVKVITSSLYSEFKRFSSYDVLWLPP